MSISVEDIEVFAHVTRDYLRLVDASTITLGQGGQGGFRGLTANQIRALTNRFFAKKYENGTGPGDMPNP